MTYLPIYNVYLYTIHNMLIVSHVYNVYIYICILQVSKTYNRYNKVYCAQCRKLFLNNNDAKIMNTLTCKNIR